MGRLSLPIQLALAVLILLAGVMVGGRACANPTYSVSLNNALPQIGKVASGSVASSLDVDPSNGAITISPVGPTSAQFIPYNATRTSLISVSLTCSQSKCGQTGQTSTLTIAGTTTTTGRFGQINGIKIVAPAGLINGGGTTASTSGSTLTVTIAPFTGTKTITVGLSVPVATTGTLGTASSTWTVTLGNSTTGTSQAQGSVEGKLGITKTADLRYGTIILIAGQSGTMTWDAANQTLSTSPAAGLVVQRGSTSIATFNVTGTPGQTIGFQLSGNPGLQSAITLTNGQGNTINITPSTTGQSSQTIPMSGTFTFYLGGTISITPTMHTGAYSGTVTLTASYQ